MKHYKKNPRPVGGDFYLTKNSESVKISLEKETAVKRTSSDKSKLTESCRGMRGARESYHEYILELCTEQRSVGCNGLAHVIVPEYLQILTEVCSVNCT